MHEFNPNYFNKGNGGHESGGTRPENYTKLQFLEFILKSDPDDLDAIRHACQIWEATQGFGGLDLDEASDKFSNMGVILLPGPESLTLEEADIQKLLENFNHVSEFFAAMVKYMEEHQN